jgi:hypothetical protein
MRNGPKRTHSNLATLECVQLVTECDTGRVLSRCTTESITQDGYAASIALQRKVTQLVALLQRGNGGLHNFRACVTLAVPLRSGHLCVGDNL